MNQLIDIGSNILSTESDVNICIGKAWTAIDRLTTLWKYGFSDIMKLKFFQVVAVSVLLYGGTSVFNEMRGEKAKWELDTDIACCFK